MPSLVVSQSHYTHKYSPLIGMVLGCYLSIVNKEKADHFFGLIPEYLDKRKYGGKELPTELLVRKKSASCIHYELN